MCKTNTTQNFCALRLLWHSFGDICRAFQPTHHKNQEFHFFIKLCTKLYLALSCLTAKHRQVQNPHNSNISCTETFMVFVWGHLEGIPTFTSQKRRISVFNKNTPPSNLALSCYTAKLGHVQDPHNS